MSSAPEPTRTFEVFYSYAHKDEYWRKKLEIHLSTLKRQGLITDWHDRNIGAGKEWAKEIDEHINTANIILLLISPDYIASDYCYSVEMQRALERHAAQEARVIPIILRPVYWKDTPMHKLQALPKNAKPITKWPNRDIAFVDIAESIQMVIGELTLVPAKASQAIFKASDTSPKTVEEWLEEANLLYKEKSYIMALGAFCAAFLVEGVASTYKYLKRRRLSEASELKEH